MTAKKRKLNYLLESILVSSVIGIIIPSVYAIRDLITGVIKQPHLMMVGFVFSFTVSFVIYFFNVRLVKWMQARDNRYRSQLLRIVIEVMVTSALAAILMGIVFNMFTFISNMNQVMHMVRTAMFDSIVIALIVNSVVLIILETLFFFRKWKFSLVEAEHLRRKTIESQYAALTSQINPHFLFNSLNALSSLINEDKKKALKFTSEFSRIYRYVLDSKEKLIVTVDE